MRPLLAVLLCLSAFQSHADKNFILAGDSWAQFMCWNQAFNKAFNRENVKKIKIHCNDYAKLGARAHEWDGSKESNNLNKFASQASVIYLSLGGNDFLYRWKKSMTPEVEQDLIDEVTENLRRISQELVALNPEVKVLISGYDFGNFARYTQVKSYRKLYKRMGEPTPLELNLAFLRLSQGVVRAADFQNVFYIHHYGVMHYWKGNGDHGLKKKQTLNPDEISTSEDPLSYGGVLELPVSRGSVLRMWPAYYDPFHLSPKGYYYLALHSTRNYLKKWLGPDRK